MSNCTFLDRKAKAKLAIQYLQTRRGILEPDLRESQTTRVVF